MTDTEILNTILQSIRISASDQVPVSPARLGNWADWIEQERVRGADKGTDEWKWADRKLFWQGTRRTGRKPQNEAELEACCTDPHEAFWRCKHMPSAIDNYFSHDVCVHGCQPTRRPGTRME